MAELFPPLFRMLKRMYTMLLVGLLLVAFTSFILVKYKILEAGLDPSFDRIFQVIAIFISLTLLFFGFRIFSKKIMSLRHSDKPALEKLSKYREACLIWWAMIESPGFFALICFILIQNYAFLVLGLFHLLLLALFMPKWNNIQLLLNIGENELDH